MKIKRTIIAVMSLVGLMGFAGCAADSGSDPADAAAPEQEVSTIRVGYTPDPGGAPLLAIAEAQGYFEENGIDATLTPFNTGPVQVQAMSTNDLDVGWIGPGAMWLPADGKANVISMNLVDLSDVILATPDSGITSVEDLKGQKVGVTVGTSGDMLLMHALDVAGMDESDIEKVHMDPPTLVAAFNSGNIDIVASWRAAVSSVFETMPDVTLVASDEDYFPEYVPVGAYVVSDKYLAENSGALGRFVHALQQANDYRYDHPEETLEITSKFLEVDPDRIAPIFEYVRYFTTEELVEYSKDGTIEKWLQDEVGFFVKMDKVTNPKAASEFYLSDLYVDAWEKQIP